MRFRDVLESDDFLALPRCSGVRRLSCASGRSALAGGNLAFRKTFRTPDLFPGGDSHGGALPGLEARAARDAGGCNDQISIMQLCPQSATCFCLDMIYTPINDVHVCLFFVLVWRSTHKYSKLVQLAMQEASPESLRGNIIFKKEPVRLGVLFLPVLCVFMCICSTSCMAHYLHCIVVVCSLIMLCYPGQIFPETSAAPRTPTKRSQTNRN